MKRVLSLMAAGMIGGLSMYGIVEMRSDNANATPVMTQELGSNQFTALSALPSTETDFTRKHPSK